VEMEVLEESEVCLVPEEMVELLLEVLAVLL
jgi:hypothetical protein